MTVEYLPVGVKCNLKCTYCYQEPMRDAGNFSSPVNFHKVKQSIIDSKSNFALFGGEPLLTSMQHLEEIFEFGNSRDNNNGLQTNGLLINPDHVDLFKKYNVHVGVSIDGPATCNSARCSDFDTDIIISNIKGMRQEGIQVSLILTVHKLNYMYMSDFLSFIDEMEECGINYFNFHNLEVDNCSTDIRLKLSDIDNFRAFRSIYEHGKKRHTQSTYNPFYDIRNLLTSKRITASCIWGACDPTTTPAVHGINAEGSLVNCGRTNKLGVDWLKSPSSSSNERYIALSLTPQAYGGCKDCKYFYLCKGNCPGTAIDGDWRNRTQDCIFWYNLIDYIRTDLMSQGTKVLDLNVENEKFIATINQQQHGDILHGDSPHGDYHGDHTDQSGNGAEYPA